MPVKMDSYSPNEAPWSALATVASLTFESRFAHLVKILPFPLIDAMKLEGSEFLWPMRERIYRVFGRFSFYCKSAIPAKKDRKTC